MKPIDFEAVSLPRFGALEQLRGKSVDEANALLRPARFELISSDHPIPLEWPQCIYERTDYRHLSHGEWQDHLYVRWFEKLRVREWRRFYSFAIHPRGRPDETHSAFIYQRRRHREAKDMEYVPVVFVAIDMQGRIVQAWKSWCLSVRRRISSGNDPRWKRWS